MTGRVELFGISQLETHARILASKHEFESGLSRELLLRQLAKNEASINRCYQFISESSRRGHRMSPATEWLLDNYHLIQEQIELAQTHLSAGYSRGLPRLAEGQRRGFPRIYDIVMEVVRHSGGQVSEDNLIPFIQAYQECHTLTLGELWAVPIMLRLSLIEKVLFITQRIAWRRGQRDLALHWAGRFLKTVENSPRMFVATLGDFARTAPHLTPPFVSELVANIDGVDPAFGMALNWLEQELRACGQTIESVLQSENQAQSADLAAISNCITSMRTMAAIDWESFVETSSAVEAVLLRDPAGVYPQMDFRSRNRYRTQVEELARSSRMAELDVAEAVVNLAAERRQANTDRRESHVGYFLLDAGRDALETRIGGRTTLHRRLIRRLKGNAFALYLASVAAIAVALAAVPSSTVWGIGAKWATVLWAGVVLMVASRPAIALVNWVVTLFAPPRFLPSLDFDEGIPPEHRTIVVVPTMLGSPAQNMRLLEGLEIRYLGNRVPNLLFALLTDFADADVETLPTDRKQIDTVANGIRELNERHGQGKAVFFLLHRPRRWNPLEGKWMGRERKRGKLEDFNRLVVDGQTEAFSVIEGDPDMVRSVRYAITLDTDTQLPPGSASRLAGTMAHLLNRPHLDPVSRMVTKGHAVLQPRVGVNLISAYQSLFARLRAGEVGIDPYTREVASVYPDVFGRAHFVGKGIYDIQTFHAATGERFPDNRILSHDLIEGCHARCGFINDVELIENEPAGVIADAHRRHRWVRGDWQIASWLCPRVPASDGRRVRNPLDMLARWVVFDNLRRSLIPAALLVALVSASYAWPLNATARLASLLGIYFMPTALRTMHAFLSKGRRVPLKVHLAVTAEREGRQWGLELLELALAPYCAWINLDAIVRVFWRMRVRRRLLEWKTANHSERTARTSFWATVSEMWTGPVVGTVCAIPTLAGTAPTNPVILLLAALWLASPGVAWFISRPRSPGEAILAADDERFIRQLARRTWAFFDHFVGEGSHWLPPDSFQRNPIPRVAQRTSPTNIGMCLASGLAACDLGYQSPGRCLQRTTRTLDALEQLERFRGHFFNWYDIQTLKPLHPRYVSTVDSGNLTAMLIIVREGLLELMQGSFLPANWRQGLEDVAGILLLEMQSAHLRPGCRVEAHELEGIAATIRRRMEAIHAASSSLHDIVRELDAFHAAIETMEGSLAQDESLSLWRAALQQQCADLAAEIRYFAPWTSAECAHFKDGDSPDLDITLLEEIHREPGVTLTLDMLASLPRRWESRLAQMPCAEASQRWVDLLALASSRATRRKDQLRSAAERCTRCSEHDLDFLYDSRRHLLSIGYNADTHIRDTSFYDLLASESRLCSYVGVARGQLPLEHWFRLGRQLAPGAGPPVLTSWSGSMFEYLMPALVMPIYEGTLLDATCKGAVSRQIYYGRHAGVPWGISESGYNQVDYNRDYQYRAFGVPTLGVKRGLADDLVVAPYASAMALMVEPVEATRNLRLLSDDGVVGQFGLYEAVDHTPARVPAGMPFALVRSWMAHHSGMCLLAYAYLLQGQPMQRRFMADAQLKSAALLLQERVPLARPRLQSIAVMAEAENIASVEAFEPASRSFSTADTAVPEVHLLSNGRYHVMITNAGGGVSRWQGLDLTRWREDSAQDIHGFFFYIQEVGTGKTWSPTARPVTSAFDRYEAVFAQGMAKFEAVAHQIQSRLQVAVCPEGDMELRQLTLTNLSRRARTIEITSCVEPVIIEGRAESAHPAFQRLFVSSKPTADKRALLFSRRPSSIEEQPPWMFHLLTVEGGLVLRGPSYETDRMAFIGRNRSLHNPIALDSMGPLSDPTDTSLDPIGAIRYRIRIEPRQSVCINAFLGVSATEEEAETWMDRCCEPNAAERILSLAWTRSHVLLHQLRIREADAQRYARLAGSLFFASPHRRGRADIISTSRKNQAALWGHGISGDLPMVLLSITDAANLDLVRNVLQAHSYWRQKGLEADLVILSEAVAGYRQDLRDAIAGLVQAGTEGRLLDQPGGIFIRNIDQVTEDDRILFQSAARLVLSDRHGALEGQIVHRVVLPKTDTVRATPRREARVMPQAPLPPIEGLEFFNGLGGFTRDGREYILQLPPGQSTPAPWVNILANPAFGTIISESGSASTWSENANQYRLTPWHNDPVQNPSGEAFYIRDEENGSVWSPMAAAESAHGTCVCRHGHGYTVFERAHQGVFSETTVYVAIDAPVKLAVIKLHNRTQRPRRLSITGYCEWVLGEHRDRSAMHVLTHVDPQSGAIFARNAFSLDFADRLAFLYCSGEDCTLTADRTEFIGRNGTLSSPAALRRERLSNRVGAGLDPCAAIQAQVEIPPGDQIEVVFCLGAAENEDDARTLLRQYGGTNGARLSLERVWAFWRHQLGGIHIETPDASVNFLVNYWLLYQILSSRFWGRTGFYQSGGAYGFRDQLQDSLAFLYEFPWLTREHLLLSASRQFLEGDVQHWWHPPIGRGARTRISDDLLWLPYVLCRYVAVTGDIGILDESRPFLESDPLMGNEESAYDQPRLSDETASLYEHAARAIRHALRFGPHGLPFIGSGDWNDGMNRVGRQGRGESVWLGFFLFQVLREFGPLAARYGDKTFAATCEQEAERLATHIDRHAWDGKWYLRAFFDDGTPLGSSQSPECQIDSIPQSWAVLTGATDPERARTAMQSVLDRLVDREHRLVRLFDPPFDAAPWDPGYIKGYPPGVRENGGQYTHAAVWTAMAFAALGQRDTAWEIFQYLNPIRHGNTLDNVGTYRLEPYVLAADVYTMKGHEGRGGWSWYTGSAAWLYRLLIEDLLGIRLEADVLSFKPLLPAEWTEFRLTYRYGNTFYHIHFEIMGDATWNTRRVIVDGVECPDLKIHLVDDDREHHALVQLG